MSVLKRIGVLSFAKIYGAIGAIIGFILGLVVSLVGVAAGSFGAFGVFSIVILPIIYGLLMFIMGAVSAFLYNVIAKRVGGVELEFDQKKRR